MANLIYQVLFRNRQHPQAWCHCALLGLQICEHYADCKTKGNIKVVGTIMNPFSNVQPIGFICFTKVERKIKLYYRLASFKDPTPRRSNLVATLCLRICSASLQRTSWHHLVNGQKIDNKRPLYVIFLSDSVLSTAFVCGLPSRHPGLSVPIKEYNRKAPKFHC